MAQIKTNQYSIADDAITLAKMAGGTDGNIITYDASGNPAVVAVGTSGHFLKSQGAGNVPVFAADNTGGITESDTWRIGGSLTMSASINTWTTITTNWNQATGNGFDTLGTGLSQSSGVFSFPSTGYWWIFYNFILNAAAGAGQHNIRMLTTLDNSSYGEATYDNCSLASTNYSNSLSQTFIFDVTNTTNCKFKFDYYTGVQNNLIVGDTSMNTSSMSVLRLADT